METEQIVTQVQEALKSGDGRTLTIKLTGKSENGGLLPAKDFCTVLETTCKLLASVERNLTGKRKATTNWLITELECKPEGVTVSITGVPKGARIVVDKA